MRRDGMILGPVAVDSLDHEGHGVARRGGTEKVAFIDGALPGETVSYTVLRSKASYEFATVAQVHRESALRVTPRCRHFGDCGGCSMQHLDPAGQVAMKQRVLEDQLWHIGRVRPERMLSPIHGPAWAYRQRSRLSVRLVRKKGGVLVGFREKRSSYVADMASCEILPVEVSRLLPDLRALVSGLSISDRLPQVEVAVGDRVTVLVFRILEPLTPADEESLRAFADRNRVQVWLQVKGPETARPFHPLDAPELSYSLPEFGLDYRFSPTEYTQVNAAVNRSLVRRAMDLLDPRPGERIADLFCGLGNFSLPIARRGARVLGIEGSPGLVRRAAENAARNGLSHLAEFHDLDLFRVDGEALARFGRFDGMLIDPPRDGALEVVKSLPEDAPRRIVYVSCNPATLARDAGVLVNVHGYRLAAAGIANMFPHTSHVESVALFSR